MSPRHLGLGDALRSLQRGTRFRAPGSSGDNASADVQPSVAELWHSASEASIVGDGRMMLVLDSYFGLSRYPTDLAGEDGLVGHVAKKVGHGPAGRSTVAALVSEVAEMIDLELPEAQIRYPEPDPTDRFWFRRPHLLNRSLDTFEVSRAIEAAFDIAVDRIELCARRNELSMALGRVCAPHSPRLERFTG